MKKTFNKILVICLMLVATAVTFTACGGGNFDPAKSIMVLSREEGSGTRGAFIELTGVQTKVDGNTKDNTTTEAVVFASTEAILTQTASNPQAIGYVSMGSLKNTVKALKVGGVAASVENINNGTYALSRPFNIMLKKGAAVNDLAQDFINFIKSDDGQKVVSDSKYIQITSTGKFVSSNPTTTKIVVGGSSSVSPVMEKLKEAYLKVNTKAKIDLQTSDSGTGVASTISGAYDIGMASRTLKDSEVANLDNQQIATDGIAVIVNTKNTCTDLTKEQIRLIYTGETKTWNIVTK